MFEHPNQLKFTFKLGTRPEMSRTLDLSSLETKSYGPVPDGLLGNDSLILATDDKSEIKFNKV